MKKTVLAFVAVTCLTLLSSCGGGTSVYSNYVVNDKDGNLIGYSDGQYLQDFEGNWIDVNWASGQIFKDADVYFSGDDCTGTVYYEPSLIGFTNYVVKTYPYMYGDNSTKAADATVKEFVYKITSIATGTEKIKSFLELDDTYVSINNPYNPDDTSTWKYKCTKVADWAAGKLIGSCKVAGKTTCVDTATRAGSASTCGNNVWQCDPSTGAAGVFTAYDPQTELPLDDQSYTREWGVLTDIAQDVVDEKITVDYSSKAPLKLVSFK